MVQVGSFLECHFEKENRPFPTRSNVETSTRMSGSSEWMGQTSTYFYAQIEQQQGIELVKSSP